MSFRPLTAFQTDPDPGSWIFKDFIVPDPGTCHIDSKNDQLE